MSTRGGTLHAPAEARTERPHQTSRARLPLVVYVLALGTFLMGTTEFVVAGLLPEIAGDLQVSVARTGLMITVFAVGMIVGAPPMAMLTLRLPKRLTLMLALGVFAAGHVIVARGSDFTLLLAARFLTAIATGAFWAVANVAAAYAVGPAASSRALGLVGAGAMLANVVGRQMLKRYANAVIDGIKNGYPKPRISRVLPWPMPPRYTACCKSARPSARSCSRRAPDSHHNPTALPGNGASLMRATLLYGAGDVRVENVPDPVIKHPTDALVRITASCVCGSDLWPYASMKPEDGPARMGHEFIGVVEETGSEVTTLKRGDLVVAPFAISDNTCAFCIEGLHTSCAHAQANFWDGEAEEGGQAEAVRVPLADGTLVKLPVAPDSALIPSLLTLSDVLGTGHHAAVAGGVNERTRVTVIGDGAVGLLGVLSAKRLGAEQIVLMGRHQARTDLGREFGATDVISARGDEGIAQVRELTGGHGTHVVLECVGNMPAYQQATGIVRPGGVISRVGVPQYEEAPIGFGSLFRHNIRLAGGPAPVRAYIEELMPDILNGTIEPGKVFDASTNLDGVPAGYQDMADRTSLKVLVKP